LTLPKAPCAILALDIVDVTGVHEVNIEGRLHKHSLDEKGKMKGITDAVSIFIMRGTTILLNENLFS